MEPQVLQNEVGSVSSSAAAANHSFGTAEYPRGQQLARVCQNPAPNSTENQFGLPGAAQLSLRSVSRSTEEPGTGKAEQG